MIPTSIHDHLTHDNNVILETREPSTDLSLIGPNVTLVSSLLSTYTPLGHYLTRRMEALLKLLEENALASVETLAAQLNSTPEQVREQIKTLQENGTILAFKAIIDDEKARRNIVRAVIEVKITPEREGGFNRLANRIAQYREVKSCFLMSGGFDLLVFIDGQTLQEVAGFVSEKLSTLPGVLSTATHFNLKTYKEQGVLYDRATPEERLKVSP